MNRGQLHSNLYAEYISEVEENERERLERAQDEIEDYWDDVENGLFDDPGEWGDLDESYAEQFDDYMDYMDDGLLDDLPEIDRKETPSERYERIWSEVGY
jgi:hypothetical protein